MAEYVEHIRVVADLDTASAKGVEQRLQKTLERIQRGASVAMRLSVLDRASDRLRSVSQLAAGIVRRPATITIQAIDRASSVIRGISQQAASLAQRGVSLPVGAASAAAGAVGQLGLIGLGVNTLKEIGGGLADVFGVRLNSSMEDTRATLVAMTKSAEEADAILATTRARADRTPFEFQDYADSLAGLLTASRQGGGDLTETMKLAEILAAVNPEEGLRGAAFALREATSGDYVSLQERFNLSRSTINRLKDEGVPALQLVRQALAEVGFDESLVENRSKTLTGRLSTLWDTIKNTSGRAGKGLFDRLADGIGRFQKVLDDNKDTIAAWADGIGNGIGKGLDTLGGILKIGQAIVLAFTTDAGAMGLALDYVGETFGEGAKEGVQPFFHAIMTGIPRFLAFIQNVKDAIGGTTSFTHAFGPAGKLLDTLRGALTRLLPWLAENLPRALDWLANVAWPAVSDAVQWVWDKISGFLEFLGTLKQKIDEYHALDGFQSAWDNIRSAVETVIDWIGPKFKLAADGLGGGNGVADTLAKVIGGIGAAFDAVSKAIDTSIKWIFQFLDRIGQAIDRYKELQDLLSGKKTMQADPTGGRGVIGGPATSLQGWSGDTSSLLPSTAAPISRAAGGPITEPVVGVGLRSGRPWTFGERGTEWVVNREQAGGLVYSPTVHVTVNGRGDEGAIRRAVREELERHTRELARSWQSRPLGAPA